MKLLKVIFFLNTLTVLGSDKHKENMEAYWGKDAFNELKNLQSLYSIPQNSWNKNNAIAQLRDEAEESKNNNIVNTSKVTEVTDYEDVD